MPDNRIDFDDPRFPAWECPGLLEKAATLDRLLEVSTQAIDVVSGDPLAAYLRCSNYHTSFLGPQRLFHDEAAEFVSQVKGQFDFSMDSPWYQRRGEIAGLIRSFFPENGQELGTLTVTPMRRPAHNRSDKNRGISVSMVDSPTFRILSRRADRGWNPKVCLGGFAGRFDMPIVGLPFACAAGSKPRDNRWTKVFIQRRVQATQYRLRPDQEYYRETWLCQAVPGGDNARLSQGHIPAIPLNRYQDSVGRIRTSPILNLVKINIADQEYQWLAIEIDTESGGLFLSVRYSVMPFSVFLLNASPAEHIGMCLNLRKLKYGQEANAQGDRNTSPTGHLLRAAPGVTDRDSGGTDLRK